MTNTNAELARQEFAEQLGEKLLRPYLDAEKIKRAIHPSCGYCSSRKGRDGHAMLTQEFIGNLVQSIISTAESNLAREVLVEAEQVLRNGYKGLDAASGLRPALRDLFTRLNVKIEEG